MINTYPEVTRVAILVGCASSNDAYLPGVSRDLENMRAFLRSPRSGCFFDNEIHTIENANSESVTSLVRLVNADYCMVYFSGHGFTESPLLRRMICLDDGDVPDSFLFTASKTELVIIDACRTHVPTISGIPEYVEPYDSFTGSLARLEFDNCIRRARPGRQIVYSTKDNAESWDGKDGGAFTFSLLSIASNMHFYKSELAGIFLTQLLPHVVSKLREKHHENQTPEIVSETIQYNMPFIINALQVPKNKRIRANRRKERKPELTQGAQLLTAALVLFGLYTLLDD